MDRSVQASKLLFRCLAILAAGFFGGCAALTNPVADGVPVNEIGWELLAESREGLENVPLGLLRQPVPPLYRLAEGDWLGVYVETILGEPTQPAIRFPDRPLRFPERGDLPPSVGYPVPVREGGVVHLPEIGRVAVQGKTVAEAEEAIRKAYIQKGIFRLSKERIIVTLMRPRMVHVTVFRQDTPPGNIHHNFVVTDVGVSAGGGHDLIGSTTTGSGHVVDLPAYENDVASALALSGGFPGSTATEIVIYRNTSRTMEPRELLPPPETLPTAAGEDAAEVEEIKPVLSTEIIRIPLRVRCCDELPFGPEDIILQNGDIMYVNAGKVDVFYTAGLLPPGEHVLPRDYDLDVIQAIARVRGPLVNGAFAQSNLNGTIIAPGIGNPNPSLLTVLRQVPGHGRIGIRVDLNRTLQNAEKRLLVRPGDVLILQESRQEALARYFTQQFHFTFISRIIQTSRTTGTIDFVVP